jgi:hypothetical protein
MKNAIFIIGAILLAAALAGGGFYAGMQYQISQADQVQQQFIQARGEGQFPGGGQMPADGQFSTDGQMPGGQMSAGGRGGMFGAGLSGEIKSVEGDVLILSTAQDVSTINLTDDTTVHVTETGALSDLEPGMRVMVITQTDEDGNVTATQVTVLNGDSAAIRTAP